MPIREENIKQLFFLYRIPGATTEAILSLNRNLASWVTATCSESLEASREALQPSNPGQEGGERGGGGGERGLKRVISS